jgi:plastocyanin
MKSASYVMTISLIAAVATRAETVRAKHAGLRAPATPQTVALTESPTASAVEVRIDNFKFLPRELKIDVGTKVTWSNSDDVPHTVTSTDDPQTLHSDALDTDDKFSFTFTKPGKYSYYCKVHPHMTGVVIVK